MIPRGLPSIALQFIAMLTLGLQFASAQPLAGAYTINGDSATAGSNFATFTDFASALDANGVSGPVVATVQPGTGPYYDQAYFGYVAGSSSTNTITIDGSNDTLIFDTLGTGYAIMSFDSASHFTVENLALIGIGAQTSNGIWFGNGADSNSVINCFIDVYTLSDGASCIAASANQQYAPGGGNNANYLTIENCTLLGGQYGVRLNGSSSQDCFGNRVSNCTISDFEDTGVYCWNQSEMEVIGNDISRANRVSGSDFTGVSVRASYDCDIVGNRIHNSHDNMSNLNSHAYGIEFIASSSTSANPHRVINNAIYGLNGHNLLEGIYNNGTSYVQCLHNTISLDAVVASSSYAAYGMHHAAGGLECVFKNNIVSITRGGNNSNYGIHLSTASNYDCDFNLVYVNSSGNGTDLYGYRNASNQQDLDDWVTEISDGTGIRSKEADPQFANLADGDLTPTNTIACNRGDLVEIETDIDGNLRDMPDLGAIEHCEAVTNVHVHALTDTSVTIRWDTITGPTVYKLILQHRLLETKTLYFKHGNQGQKHIEGLDSGTRYGIYISPQIDGGWTYPTRVVWFNTLSSPCQPVTSYSVAPIGAVQARINWTSPSGVDKIWMRWRAVGDSAWIDTVKRNPSASAQWITGLAPGTNYLWQIKSACSVQGYGSDWSPVQQFSTLSNKSDESEFNLVQGAEAMPMVFPNPASNHFVVAMPEQYNSTDMIRLYDTTGRIVVQQAINVGQATHVAVSTLPNGLYFLTFPGQERPMQVVITH